MKRILSAVFALIAVFCVVLTAAACGEEKTPDTGAQSETQKPETPATGASETEAETEAATVTEKSEDTESAATSGPVTEPVTQSVTESVTETQSVSETVQGITYEYAKAKDYADLDFAGKTFNIFYRWEPESMKPSGYGFVYDLYEDPNNPDDMMTAAVAFRRNTMKMYYNCDVIGTPSLPSGDNVSELIDSGDAKYDMVISAYSINSYNRGSRYYNLMPMMNLSYDCWDKAIIRDLAFGGKIYGMTGDLTTTDEDYTFVLFFNKDMLKENNQPDPYELVRNNQWTMEKFFEIARSCMKELDGDNEMTSKDQFGLNARYDTWRYFYYGTGSRFVSPIQDDGSVKWAANDLGYEADVYAMALEILHDPCIGHAEGMLGAPDGIRESFGSGHAAFYVEGLYNIHYEEIDTGLRDYENLHFGILPAPKWNSEQTSYYSYVWEQGGFVGIPATCNFQTAADFLNVYALATQATVQKAYINAIAYSYASDANVAEMLDIIMSNRIWCASLWIEKTVDATLCSDCNSNKNRLSSRLKSGQDKIMKAIDEATQTNLNNPN
ncbi:MAG: hypothetical protein J5940_04515 [Clostridia bacterium]|nr:hypothetical protein [Clostridia bacterium]